MLFIFLEKINQIRKMFSKIFDEGLKNFAGACIYCILSMLRSDLCKQSLRRKLRAPATWTYAIFDPNQKKLCSKYTHTEQIHLNYYRGDMEGGAACGMIKNFIPSLQHARSHSLKIELCITQNNIRIINI